MKTRQKSLDLGQNVLLYLPYSSFLAFSDFHQFRSFQNPLNGQNFNIKDDVQIDREAFFVNKYMKFFDHGSAHVIVDDVGMK